MLIIKWVLKLLYNINIINSKKNGMGPLEYAHEEWGNEKNGTLMTPFGM